MGIQSHLASVKIVTMPCHFFIADKIPTRNKCLQHINHLLSAITDILVQALLD